MPGVLRRFTMSLAAAACLLLCTAGNAPAAQHGPGMIGIRLGQSVTEVESLVLMSTAMPVWSQEYLSRVDIAPAPGFRGGYVSYGNCAVPGRILRMKLNYEDSGQEMYGKLLAALKERFGSKPEFRGDAFGSLKVWKWSVPGVKGGNVSLILENYTGDDDNYTQGTAIRLSVPKWIDEERACAAATDTSARPSAAARERAAKQGFDWYLPVK